MASFTWQKGQQGKGVQKAGVEEKVTTPPKPYTEGTLLADMKGAARFIADPKLREAMKEADGIGTPATRAAHIEHLKEVGSLRIESAKGKKDKGAGDEGGVIRSTETGKQVIGILPKMVTDPGTTALWETMLGHIAQGNLPVDEFKRRQEEATRKLVAEALASKPAISQGKSVPCSEAGCSGGGCLTKRPGKFGPYWACSKGPECGNKFDDVKGKPKLRAPRMEATEKLAGDGDKCPDCRDGILQTRVVSNPSSKAFRKSYLGCSNYPKCKHSKWPD